MVSITRILVPYDFSEPSAHALTYGMELATRFEASLDVLHVVPSPPVAESVHMYLPVIPDVLEAAVKEQTARLDEVLSPEDRKRLNARCVVKVGDPKSQIAAYAEEERADLIVVGTHGRGGMSHLLLGSVAERVVRAAPCPVVIVR